MSLSWIFDSVLDGQITQEDDTVIMPVDSESPCARFVFEPVCLRFFNMDVDELLFVNTDVARKFLTDFEDTLNGADDGSLDPIKLEEDNDYVIEPVDFFTNVASAMSAYFQTKTK